MDKNSKWDIIVVGGGPSGMMAAGTAAQVGANVLLVEKNDILGKKLLITGGGRCNITNHEFDNRKLLEKFRGNGKFLFSAFSQWSVKETLDFFNNKGVATKVENEKRVFPVSNSAQSVWDVLVDYIKNSNVTILSNSPIIEIIQEDKILTGIKLTNGEVIRGKSIIIATGGTSRPETGSTGDGYKWLEKIGHTIINPTPSLVPVALKDSWVKKLAGLTLTDIKITLLQNNTKQDSKKGKILFTHVGISGPTILNMSKDIGELLKYGEVLINLDLFPKEDHGILNSNLQELLKINHKKKIQNALTSFIPKTLVPIIIESSEIDKDTKCNSITRDERLKLIDILKNFPLQVDKLLGIDKAVITSGGVTLEEVDFKTMRSTLFPNLYLIGDILNIDRPSGGFSLQLCWTTGHVAGKSASRIN